MSREIFRKNFDKIYELYEDRHVDPDLIAMIGMITDFAELIRQGEDKEVQNMCTALDELKNEGRREGIRENVLKLLQKGFSVLEVSDLLELTEEVVLNIQQKA